MTSTLHIHLLGELLLASGDTPVTSVDKSRLQSLLAYLVLHHTAPQSRTHLAYLLWSDSTETQAHANLRTLLFRLRQALPHANAFLRIEKHTLRWQPQHVDASWTLDVLDFEHAVAQAEHAKDSAAVRVALEEAVALYSGDLLPSCYDEWILPERERLRQAFLEALERLIGVLEQERDYPAAIRAAQRLLRHDPLHETTYRHLMRLYVVCGDRAAALRMYHTCATVLERELGAEPGRATREMYEHLMQTEESTSLLVTSQTPLVAEAPLIGRQNEWAKLQAAWRSTTTGTGQPHLVMLSGEAGIGKTRLAQELFTWLGRQGIPTATACCYAAEGELAYAPAAAWLHTDALRRTLLKLPDIWLSEVVRLVPDVLMERPDLPRPGPLRESWQRQRLFEALARVIFAAPQPLLLFLDDLQWCDRETLEWVHYLLRFDRHARLLLLGTVRSEEIMAEHPVETLLTALRRDGQVTEMVLKALDAVETTSLAEHVAGHDLDPSLVASLYQETEGNPLFVVETVRAGGLEKATHSPVESRTGSHDSLFPASVQAVIATRLAQLSLNAREVVSLAAVIGRAFTFSMLSQASSGDEDTLVRGLDELWQRRIVREQGGDAYDFSHDKLREGAYAALSTARRRLLHRRALAALQAAGAPSAQLAHHALHAGLKDEAFRYSVAAGDAAMHLFAVRDAITDYEQALQVVQKQLAGRDQQTQHLVTAMHHLYMQLGRAYELNSGRQKAHAVYEAMLIFARTMHEPATECAALNRLAMLAAWSSDVGTASALLQEALRVAERSEDRAGLAETEWGLAQASYYAINAQEALLHAEHALALARECDLKELTARSLNVLAYANELLGKWEEVAALATEARTVYASLGNRAMEADCLGLFALARIFSGYPQEGIAAARSARAISVEIDNTWGQVYSARQLALGLRDTGAYSEALEVAQQGVTLARAQSLPALLILNLFVLGLVQGSMLMLEAAHTTLQEAATINEAAQLHSAREAIAAVLCTNDALDGKWTEAYNYALQAQAARDYQTKYGWQFSLCYETEALLRRGDGERAREEVQSFSKYVGEGGSENRRYRIAYLRALAVLVSWHGEIDQAIAHLQEAARLAEEISLPGEHWQIEAALAELHQKCGDERQAGNAFARAAVIVQTLANTLQDEQLRKTFLSAAQVQRVIIQGA